ncbi:aspartic proteinase nepenthesin-1-like [Papaver somniferum]|uniref:aspartic proteinase nepenthesin-1-like n=1 Tax=Papaver somniferum TaxID=3469 RepID=UPI000E6F93BA|nr:aspartic proteinase nepenthesin-1-like [Papaver somniferum]
MKLIGSDSKESPLYPRYANLTQGERFQRLFEQSKARAHYFGLARAAAYNKSSSMNPDIVCPPVKYMENGNYYIAELSSSTYRRIPCQNLDVCDAGHCEHGFCTYKQGYVSGPETSGHLAYERFTMNSDTGARESVESIIMGCGINQRNFGPVLGVPDIREGDRDFPPPKPAPGTAPIAGILGLGQGASNFSLVLQLDIEKRFEYCLEAYDVQGIKFSHTYLRFGHDTIIGEGPEVLKTPIIQNPNFGTPYHLILEDISVANRRLGFQKSDFELKPDGTGGTIIDSGDPFTIMIRPHFERVKQALLEYFEDFGIYSAGPAHGFDPCFHLSADLVEYPEMTFHFQGADVGVYI